MNEIRPKQPPAPNSPRFDDEIDLVDLVINFWRRKWIVLGVSFLVLLAAVVFAYSQNDEEQERVRISSLYEIPSVVFSGGDQLQVQNVFEPPTLSEMVSRVYVSKAKREGDIPTIDVEVPKGTNLLALSSIMSASEESRIERGVSAHQALLKRIEKAVEERVRAVGESSKSGTVMVFGGGVVESAQIDEASADPGPSKTLIVALGAILGLFAGLFAALMVGFVSAARDRLHETESTRD